MVVVDVVVKLVVVVVLLGVAVVLVLAVVADMHCVRLLLGGEFAGSFPLLGVAVLFVW